MAPPPDPQAPPSTGADEVELEMWRSVKDTENPAELEAYLSQYPNGAFSTLARTRMGALLEQKTAAATPPPPPAQQTAQQQAPAPRRSRRDVVYSVIQSELRGFSDPRLHVVPNIPSFKLGNAASVHGFDPNQILLLWDDGLGGGGKTGFAISDRKVHWRFVSGSDALWINLEDIQQVWPKKKKFQLNGYDLPVVMAQSPQTAADRFTRLFQRLAAEMRSYYG